jgi:DNA-binding transcriptional ArsR family regulator
MASEVNRALRLVAALNDPIRLAVVRHLMGGPANVSELVAHTRASQSKVSNHLALLRDAEVVVDNRLGRYVAYELADPALAAVIEAIEAATDGQAKPPADIALARSCYDHVAGRLGVAIFRSLVTCRALRNVPARPSAAKVRSSLGDVILGDRAASVFGALDIDLQAVSTERRRFATACNDWTESQPHLGGALGAALQMRLLRLHWLQRRGGTRALRVTGDGRDGLRERFGIDYDVLAG